MFNLVFARARAAPCRAVPVTNLRIELRASRQLKKMVYTPHHPTCPSQKESEVSLQKYSLLCTKHKKEYFWWGGWGRITLSSGDYI